MRLMVSMLLCRDVFFRGLLLSNVDGKWIILPRMHIYIYIYIYIYILSRV
jgi:hypothetical protein